MQAFACVASQCIAAACLHYAFIALGAMSHTAGVATPHQQPQQPADAGPLQPKVHLPQRDHGRGLVLPDTRGAQSRGGRPRHAHRVVFGLRRLDRFTSPRAGNAEAYYPHFQFDSNYTYGMVHRE